MPRGMGYAPTGAPAAAHSYLYPAAMLAEWCQLPCAHPTRTTYTALHVHSQSLMEFYTRALAVLWAFCLATSATANFGTAR